MIIRSKSELDGALAKANGGDAEAQYSVAEYFLWEDTPEMNKQAMEWMKKSASLGYVEAQFRLGECLCTGLGGEQNMTQGLEFLEKAANNGHSEAAALLKSIKQ